MTRFFSGILALGLALVFVSQAQAVMLVGDKTTGKILKYNSTTGAYIGVFADITLDGWSNPTQMDVGIGADSNTLYVNTAQGVKKYDATTGASLGSLNSTARQAMQVSTVDGNIYTAPAGTFTIFQTTPAGAGNATVWHTLGTFSYNGRFDPAINGLANAADGHIAAYVDTSGPNWVASVDVTTNVEQHTSSGTSSLRGESRFLQNIGLGSGEFTYSALNMYFEQGNKLAAMDAAPGGKFDDGTAVAPKFGNWVDQTTGTYGQVQYDPISGRTYYAISNGTLQEIRYALDSENGLGVATGGGSPTPTFHTFVADDTNLDGAWGIVVLADTTTSTVPEPSTFALAAFGLAGLGLVGWRRGRRN